MGSLIYSSIFNISDYVGGEGQMAFDPILRIRLDSGYPVCKTSVFVFPGNFFGEFEGMEVCVASCSEGASDQAWVGVPGIYEFLREAGFLHECNFPDPV